MCRNNEIEWDRQRVLVARSVGGLFISLANRDMSEDARFPFAFPPPPRPVCRHRSRLETINSLAREERTRNEKGRKLERPLSLLSLFDEGCVVSSSTVVRAVLYPE